MPSHVNNPNPYHPGKHTPLHKAHVPEIPFEERATFNPETVEAPKAKAPKAPKATKPEAEAHKPAPKQDAPKQEAEVHKPAPKAAEQVATFEVVLLEAGDSPIGLVRELREVTGKDLKDIELLVSFLPDVVSKGLSQADAEALKTRLEAAGGKVELKQS